MAADIMIRAEGLGKQYRIGHKVAGPLQSTLRDAMTPGLRGVGGRLRRMLRGRTHESSEDFWALRDVGFDVRRGEVLGVIGRNGAGKSTLLKVLSRITEPSEGRVCVSGRVASLLEVGTGFHGELTGRENIYLNGAILGMSRAEVTRKFDEIVAFSGVEKFLDTPVKRYSSGMYVRLAFAVAAHLEPEILVVDEVLAVGDVAFQKKCLGKMQHVARTEGRTVLFVSHNLQAIQQLCSRALLLASGRIAFDGAVASAIELYATGTDATGELSVPHPAAEALDAAYITTARVEGPHGATDVLPFDAVWTIRIGFRVVRPMDEFVVSVGLVSVAGEAVQTAWNPPLTVAPGDYEAHFTQDKVKLACGSYAVLAGLSSHDQSIQQVSVSRLELSQRGASEYVQVASGAGFVLNSMRVKVCRL